MGLINFVTISRAQLLKLCKEKGLKADRKITKLDLQVAIRFFEEVQRLQSIPEGDDEEEEAHLEVDKEIEDPYLGPELQGEHFSTPVDAQDGAESSVTVMDLSPMQLEDRKE
ncbi:hypothetical protein NDU88_006507 [Pleurodeles waltl]|uniref:Uncharacterized protein n=1 Tax=Pleurodeles waltl TaxID=8319 RepID=A0AAV7N3P1_PLEWA|nr:hypothetical protein NDU88_006507 [Pleurodeles waltl]